MIMKKIGMSFIGCALFLAMACGDQAGETQGSGMGGEGGSDGDTTTSQSYVVGGTVNGLRGKGLVLQNDGRDDLNIEANGMFAFSSKIAAGEPYEVTIKSQPEEPPQTCVVSAGSGEVTRSNISSVVINCEDDKFTLGGQVTGLEGSGLTLQTEAGDEVVISSDGTFAFPKPLSEGTDYEVSIKTQPTNLSQTCTLSEGIGTIAREDEAGIAVRCETNDFSVQVTVTGLVGTGLVLQNNAGDDLAIGGNGVTTIGAPLADGTSYSVTVLTQPSAPQQTCTVSGGAAQLAGEDGKVTVDCVTNSYSISGTLSGLVSGSVTLTNNGGDALVLEDDGEFLFSLPVESGSAYLVAVAAQPAGQFCKVVGGDGDVADSAISVEVACSQCGDGELDPGEEAELPSPFSNLSIEEASCTYDFSTVPQLYCNGSCTWGGGSGCDQTDADIFCKLRTGNPNSVATSFDEVTALDTHGFSCPSILGVDLGNFAQRGVDRSVWYQDTSVLDNHGPGDVVTNPVCTNPL